MLELTYTNASGQSITITDKEPYMLRSLTGTGANVADVQMQTAPFQDGATWVDTVLQPRPISIEITVFADSQEQLFARRRMLSKVFNPKLGPGELKYDYPGGSKVLEATVDVAPVFPMGDNNFGVGFQRALIELIAPLPFWLDPDETLLWLSGTMGGLSFPMKFPLKFAQIIGEADAHNLGDVETPVLIEFFGPATKPRIDNLRTGQFIEVDRVLLPGEKLVISTRFGNKFVKLINSNGVESNAMHYINLQSEFWSLLPGKNKIKFTAVESQQETIASVRWKNRYLGV